MTIKRFFRKCYNVFLYRVWYGIITKNFWQQFYKIYFPYIRWKGQKIRNKEKIRVLFVLAELGTWKTECLYLAMYKHSRFIPMLGVTESREVPGSKPNLINYLKKKNYDFWDLDEPGMSIDKLHPDLLFYYKPYDGSYPPEHIFKRHLSALPIMLNYGMSTMSSRMHSVWEICYYSLFFFVENESVRSLTANYMGKYGANLRVTGLPIQDILCKPKEEFPNPWKDTKKRKKIIYAPHHSFKGTNGAGIEYATFLEFGEFMLDIAEKFKEKVYWAFKPHPTLYPKLLKIWGKEKTDAYYQKWKEMENAQVELGDYISLFKYSDAMIHDCSSFMIEYHFTNNPVLYLDLGGVIKEDLSPFGLEGFELCYHGHSTKDIEKFIQHVINGEDKRKKERVEFYNNNLLPPNGKTASQNIIDTILNG